MADNSLPERDQVRTTAAVEPSDEGRRSFLRKAAIGLPIVLGTVPARTVWAQGSASCRPSTPGYVDGICW